MPLRYLDSFKTKTNSVPQVVYEIWDMAIWLIQPFLQIQLLEKISSLEISKYCVISYICAIWHVSFTISTILTILCANRPQYMIHVKLCSIASIFSCDLAQVLLLTIYPGPYFFGCHGGSADPPCLESIQICLEICDFWGRGGGDVK